MKAEYWTMFYYGGNPTICEKHRSLRAAQRSARACEKVGGALHWIVRAEVVLEVVVPLRPKSAHNLRASR